MVSKSVSYGSLRTRWIVLLCLPSVLPLIFALSSRLLPTSNGGGLRDFSIADFYYLLAFIAIYWLGPIAVGFAWRLFLIERRANDGEASLVLWSLMIVATLCALPVPLYLVWMLLYGFTRFLDRF
jgi:hypothetical protein